MDRAELLDVTRRALKRAQGRTTDMADAEMRQSATAYTDPGRFARDRSLVRGTPQLVGYRSELSEPGSYCTKSVMGTPVLLTRAGTGELRAFVNVCAHRQARVAQGCGVAERFTCPYHAWTYGADGRFLGAPGAEGFPDTLNGDVHLTELPATEQAGFLWVGLDPDAELDVDGHLGELGPELESWGIGDWNHIGTKTLDAPIDWKLAVDTFSENYHFATVHRTTFAQIALSNCTVFDAFGPHHRLVFPLRNITELAEQPEDEWEPFNHLVVIYALFPNIVMSVTVTNGEVFRIYPGDRPGHSVTEHMNATRLDLDDPDQRAGAEAVFEYAHGTVRDEDYELAADLQQNLFSGVSRELVFGRNEPGLQHRHRAWEDALA